MTTVTVDNSKIGLGKKATVTVSSEDGFNAMEVRGYVSGDKVWSRGIGTDLLCDDVTTTDGVWELGGTLLSATFDVEAIELGGGGTFTIVVFVRGTDGKWDDVDYLFDHHEDAVYDVNGKRIAVQRSSLTSEFEYSSNYNGDIINRALRKVYLDDV